jgi:hypothetical protein
MKTNKGLAICQARFASGVDQAANPKLRGPL